jgi:DNA topoisomerase-3
LEVVEKETQPPRPYTDATLLAAMRNAGRDLEDDALAEAMKASGLGTPATRAAIIERLIRSDYVCRERRALRSTQKGRALFGLVAAPLCSPELTAGWEQRLQDIEEGSDSAESFDEASSYFVRDWTP